MLKNKSKIFFLILSLTIAFNITLFTNSLLFESNVYNLHEINNDLRVSGPEINITSPENITYNGPMNGYYPATYGFENDKNGTSGTDIDFVDDYISNPPNTWTKIVPEFNGHKKVLECYDHSTDAVGWWHNHSAQTFGTYEFYMATSDPTYASVIYIYNGGPPTALFGFRIDLDKFRCTNSGWIDVPGAPTPVANTWYQIRIDFECTGGIYMELAQYKYQVWINNVKYGPFSFDIDESQADEIGFVTSNTDTPYETYLDAFGFSWEADYSIGDNLNEGLLLSYDIGFTPDWQGYSLDGQTNKTILGNTTIPFPSGGLHTIQVFGNDSLNAIYESEIRYFSIDLPPIIIINKPSQNDIFGLIAPSFNISIIESHLNETWYTIDGGLTNYTFSGLIGTINQTTAWDKCIEGPITIRFYANDSVGNVGFEDIIVLKDTSAPIITINIPDENEFYAGTPPNFDITIDELSLNITWYTLDNGVNNFTFIGLTGSINQTEWDKQGEGPVILRFYANDSFGYQNYSEITILKDITDPVLTIYSPITGDRFTTIPPAFNIEVNETNLESIWYTIDGGLNNYDITQLTGYIDSTAWNSAPTGAITIRFYVEDKAGNVVYTDIVVQKMSPPTPLDFNLVIIIATIILIIGIVVVGGLFYRRKHVRIRKPKPIVEKAEKTEEKETTRKRRRREKIIEPQIINCPFCYGEITSDQEYCKFCGGNLRKQN